MEAMQYTVKEHCRMYGGGYARRRNGESHLDPWDIAPVCYNVESAFEAVEEFLDAQADNVSPDAENATTSMFYVFVAAIGADMWRLIAIYKAIKRHNRRAFQCGRYADIVLFDGLTRREQHAIRRAARKISNYDYTDAAD